MRGSLSHASQLSVQDAHTVTHTRARARTHTQKEERHIRDAELLPLALGSCSCVAFLTAMNTGQFVIDHS